MTKDSSPKSKSGTGGASSASSVAAAGFVHPEVVVVPVTDPAVLDQARVFTEALKQTQPIAQPGSAHASVIAKTVREGTAMPRGITSGTAERYVTSPRSMDAFVNGANPRGKAAEVVAASDYRSLHAGYDTGMVNSAEHVATNVTDIRLAPDPASRKDLIFAFETKNGHVIWKYNGQVKTGRSQYVADTLVEMAGTPGYGKVGYVDARYVNADGTPRVGPGAFTERQARRLQEAKVRLRGIPNLEDRADLLMENIRAGKADGLDPAARQQLQQLRDDIATAYQARGIAGRIGGGAAIAAASAAVVSLVIQLTTEGTVDAKAVGQAAGTGGTLGAGGAAADAGLYHLATKAMGMAPEAAKTFAQQGVAIGFCVISVGMDLVSEVRAARRGELTFAGATNGAAAKTALNLLPLVMAPLGLAGLPLLVGAQIGGRWLVVKARDADRLIEQAIEADAYFAAVISNRMSDFSRVVESVAAECSSTDEVYRGAMAEKPSSTQPALRLVKN
jgi:hypothetical protein